MGSGTRAASAPRERGGDSGKRSAAHASSASRAAAGSFRLQASRMRAAERSVIVRAPGEPGTARASRRAARHQKNAVSIQPTAKTAASAGQGPAFEPDGAADGVPVTGAGVAAGGEAGSLPGAILSVLAGTEAISQRPRSTSN